MLRTGVEGWTENDILRYCRLHPVATMQASWSASLIFNWSVSTRKTRMVSAHTCATAFPAVAMFSKIQLVNHNAAINEHHGLSQQDITDILNLYPDAFNAA
jgi:hypothetical protein